MPAKNTSTTATIHAQLSGEVHPLRERINQSARKIRLDHRVFTFPDGRSEMGPIELVVIDFVSRNKYYPNPYQPKQARLPACFAVGRRIVDLRPSPLARQPQASACQACPLNQYGANGRGKACRNSRLLAVLRPEQTNPRDALMTLEVSPTGLRFFDNFVSATAKIFALPPVGVTVQVSFNPLKPYPSLVFGRSRANPEAVVTAHLARRSEAESLLLAEPEQHPTQLLTTISHRPAPQRQAA